MEAEPVVMAEIRGIDEGDPPGCKGRVSEPLDLIEDATVFGLRVAWGRGEGATHGVALHVDGRNRVDQCAGERGLAASGKSGEDDERRRWRFVAA